MKVATAFDRVAVCGIGEDAAHLVARGVRLDATDVSSEMIRVVACRGGFTLALSAPEEIAGLEPAKVEA
jgi:hypothetical protein